MRRFELHRAADTSGVSGLGVVAEGVEFGDGRCEMRWLSPKPHGRGSHDSVQDILDIHGHDGATRLVWLDPEPDPSTQAEFARRWREATRQFELQERLGRPR